MSKSRTHCHLCQGEMQPIRLNDATAARPGPIGITHVEPTYSNPDAKASWWTGKVPAEGTVKGMICVSCGQIQLYGTPLQS